MGGILIAIFGICGIAYVWYLAVRENLFYEGASFAFPGFAVVGAATACFQGYKEERLARGENLTRLQGWKLLTPRWKAVFIVAIALGFTNYLILRLSFNWSE